MTTKLESASADTRARYHQLFVLAAVYDVVLGAAFFLLSRPIFNYLIIPLPENLAYVQLCGAFVLAQGVGYWYIAQNMVRNVDLAKVGILCKVAYTGIAAYYLIIGQLPHIIFAVFAACDLVFAIVFLRFVGLAREA